MPLGGILSSPDHFFGHRFPGQPQQHPRQQETRVPRLDCSPLYTGKSLVSPMGYSWYSVSWQGRFCLSSVPPTPYQSLCCSQELIFFPDISAVLPPKAQCAVKDPSNAHGHEEVTVPNPKWSREDERLSVYWRSGNLCPFKSLSRTWGGKVKWQSALFGALLNFHCMLRHGGKKIFQNILLNPPPFLFSPFP